MWDGSKYIEVLTHGKKGGIFNILRQGDVIWFHNFRVLNAALPNPSVKSPTNPFTVLELQDQEIGEFHGVQERRATDFEAERL